MAKKETTKPNKKYPIASPQYPDNHGKGERWFNGWSLRLCYSASILLWRSQPSSGCGWIPCYPYASSSLSFAGLLKVNCLTLTRQPDPSAAGGSERLRACRTRVRGRSSSGQRNPTRPEALLRAQSTTATPSRSPNQRRRNALRRCPSASGQNQPACSRNIVLSTAGAKEMAEPVSVADGLVGCAYSCKRRQRCRTLHQESNLRDYSHITNFLKWGSPTKRLKITALQNSIIWDTIYQLYLLKYIT